MISPAPIVGDAAFAAFQSKLATVVTNARACGWVISARSKSPDCRCPLGAHPDSSQAYPPAFLANREGWPEVPTEHLRSFIHGFGGGSFADGVTGPYADLGREYRRWFP